MEALREAAVRMGVGVGISERVFDRISNIASEMLYRSLGSAEKPGGRNNREPLSIFKKFNIMANGKQFVHE